jgi:hypothetical protein
VRHPVSRRTAIALATATIAAPAFARFRRPGPIAQWGVFEAILAAPPQGDPFAVNALNAVFEGPGRSAAVAGFYDGSNLWRVRFMPDKPGRWRYRTQSGNPALDGKTGEFEVVPARSGNHGPVAVANTFHFAYADGVPYRPFGTTSYACTHQPDALCEQTLATLAASPFNKLRFAVFPNEDVPTLPLYPFAGSPGAWDFNRLNPLFFRRLERFVARLSALGIEADVILFHPYDHGKWGFDAMPRETDERYLRHIVARLSAYRNVWWSLANEYDVIRAKTDADFDHLFQVVKLNDPYDHLRSIHHLRRIYDNSRPWVTHASLQNGSAVEDDGRAVLYRDVWRKPVVFDEVKYEGNLAKRWGNLSGPEMVRRFWEAAIGGTYAGHGETIEDADHHMWLADGGVLRGESPARIGFLRRVLEQGPPAIDPIDKWQDRHLAGVPGKYYLRYFGEEAPGTWPFVLPKEGVEDGDRFAVDILDTWAMTVTPVTERFTVHKSGDYDFAAPQAVTLPGKPRQALRIRKL